MSWKLLYACLVVVLLLSAAACQPGDDADESVETRPTATETGVVLDQGDDEVHGAFSMVVMAHTTSYAGTDVEQEQESNPWDGGTDAGPYRYAAIPCNQDAPLNNISGDLPTFNTLIPGSRVPASTRAHPLEFDVSEGDDGEMELEGTLDLTVCQLRPGVTPDPDPVPDPEKDRIRFEWTARAAEASQESVVWRGEFRIVGGTGRYEDLSGEGEIAGYFFCFAPEGCEEIGEFRDVQLTMAGTYDVPTEALEAASPQPTAEADEATDEPTETEEPTEAATDEPTEEATDEVTEEPTPTPAE